MTTEWSSYDRTWFSGPDKQEILILTLMATEILVSKTAMLGHIPTTFADFRVVRLIDLKNLCLSLLLFFVVVVFLKKKKKQLVLLCIEFSKREYEFDDKFCKGTFDLVKCGRTGGWYKNINPPASSIACITNRAYGDGVCMFYEVFFHCVGWFILFFYEVCGCILEMQSIHAACC
jgi:hypothetical protein